MALISRNADTLYFRTLAYVIEQHFYTESEAAFLMKVKNYVNNCVWELIDTKKELIGFLQNVDVNAEDFYAFVQLKHSRFSELNKIIEILRNSLKESNQDLICDIQVFRNRKEKLLEDRFSLESEKEYLLEKMAIFETESQQIDSDMVQVADNLDATVNESKKGKVFMGLGLGIVAAAAALPATLLAAPAMVLGAAITLRAAKNVSNAVTDNQLLGEEYQELQYSYEDLEAEIQDVYQKLESIYTSLETLPELITVLTNKSDIFQKIFLFICTFEVHARNCQLPLKHIITICDANREPPLELENIRKRNKETLSAKITKAIETNLKYFDRISNQTLDFQIKIKDFDEVESHLNSTEKFRFNYARRNLLADSNPNGQYEVSKNADYRWEFNGPWKYGTPVFLHTHHDPDFENKFVSCFETSCYDCKKFMTIDLEDIGMTYIINTYQPPIVFSEWIVNRADCGSKYQASIALLDSSFRVIDMEKTEIVFQQWQLQKWQKVELKVQSYPTGIRFIRITSGGKDTQFWAGHYGVKIAGSELKIDLDDIPPINLIADENPKGNKITRHADSRWHFSGPWKYTRPVFLDNHFHPNFVDEFAYCFETSYTECMKALEVDLKKIGMLHLFDYYQPSIIFSEWVVNRADCGSKYSATLELLDKSHRVIAETKDERHYKKWHLQKWEKVILQIQAYPPGVHFIRITSSGQDTQFWKGHYGVKITESRLLLKLT